MTETREAPGREAPEAREAEIERIAARLSMTNFPTGLDVPLTGMEYDRVRRTQATALYDAGLRSQQYLDGIVAERDGLRWVVRLADSYLRRYGLANTSGERHEDRKQRTEDLRGEIAALVNRYPDLRALLSGNAPLPSIPGERPPARNTGAHWRIERDESGTPVRMWFAFCDDPECCPPLPEPAP